MMLPRSLLHGGNGWMMLPRSLLLHGWEITKTLQKYLAIDIFRGGSVSYPQPLLLLFQVTLYRLVGTCILVLPDIGPSLGPQPTQGLLLDPVAPVARKSQRTEASSQW